MLYSAFVIQVGSLLSVQIHVPPESVRIAAFRISSKLDDVSATYIDSDDICHREERGKSCPDLRQEVCILALLGLCTDQLSI